jgi:tRNA pseudouridine32 synthase/23S rRNA pseudouridine746 synthase
MKEVEGEPNSETHIEVIDKAEDSTNGQTLYRLMPVTGRKHQLRLHMSGLGIAIVNDRLYPKLSLPPLAGSGESFSSPLKLLAESVSFEDPLTGREYYFQSRRTL